MLHTHQTPRANAIIFLDFHFVNDRLPLVTAAELTKVRSLLERGSNSFSGPQIRRLRAIEYFGSVTGTTQAAAAEALRITRQTLNQIVQRLRGPQQVAAEIESCEARLVKNEEKRKQRPQRRGRPGNTVWEDIETTIGIIDKALIEIASIIVSGSACIAVLAVRAPGCVHETIEEFSRYGWDDARWSNVSAFDWLASKAMEYLREGVLSMDPGQDHTEAAVSPVSDRFDRQCTYYVLENEQLDGAEDARRALFPSGSGFQEVSLPSEGYFFDHLDQLLCRLRERHSCIGFLPGLQDLYQATCRWNDNAFESPFHWHTDQDHPIRWREKRTTGRLYLAQSGCLHELSPTLWSQLPYAKRSKFRTLKSRPKVTVAGHDAAHGTVTLFVQPLPECGYPVTIETDDDPEEVAKRHRELLRGDSPGSRFIYSASAEETHLIRPSFLVEDARAESGKSEITGTGVVLVPRHFLLPAPEVDLEQLAVWTESLESTVRSISAQEARTDSDLRVMVMPEIMQGIEEAFRANRYGDAHRELWRQQERLRHAQSELRNVVDLQRRVNLLGVDPYSGPYYHFSGPELASGMPTHQVHERFAHRLFALEGKQERAEPASENLFWSGEPFAYHGYRTLLALLLDFDADFLLLGLAAEISRKVVASTERWGEQVRDIILRKVQREGQTGLNADLLWRVARRNPETVDDKIIDCFTSTLPIFCERHAYSARRRAVENAQRLALAWYKPKGIVVESEESIFRSWRSYFGQRARGLLTEAAADEQKEQQQRRELAGWTGTGPVSNHQGWDEQIFEDDEWDEGESPDESNR